MTDTKGEQHVHANIAPISNRTRATSALAAAALVGGLIAGCGATASVATTPKQETSAAGNDAKTAPSNAVAKVGSTVTLKGNTEGLKVDVTVLKVIATVKATDDFSTPQSGNRFAAVQFRLHNVGTASYDDSPSNGAKVGDAEAQQFNSTIIAQKISAGPLLPASVKLAPNGTAVGWVVFEVPKASKLTMVQFGLESGFGQTGEWKVG
jgi:hypothetical protein